MINDGYFKNAYIDESMREIVLAQSAMAASTASFGGGVGVSTRIVSCPCCGANNAVAGAAGECEYCGSPLA